MREAASKMLKEGLRANPLTVETPFWARELRMGSGEGEQEKQES